MPPPSRFGKTPSPFVETVAAGRIQIKVHERGLMVDVPGALTAAEIIWMLGRPRMEIVRWLVGDPAFGVLCAEFDQPEGFVDDDTFTEILSVPVEHCCGIPFDTVMSLIGAARLYWSAVQSKAGWDVDLGTMPARRFCLLVIATMVDSKTTEDAERISEYTARLLRDTGTAVVPMIRRKNRRRRRQRPSEGATP